MEYILVGVGGVCGSLARYVIGIYLNKKKEVFPFGTFAVNIIGAFLLGVVFSFQNMNNDYRVLLADGFLGAFTTFSTFMFENYQFINARKFLNAGIYVGVSLSLGIAGFCLGRGLL